MDEILKQFHSNSKITYNVFDLNKTSIEDILNKVTLDVYKCANPLSPMETYTEEVNNKVKWGLDKDNKGVEELKKHFSIDFFLMQYLHHYLNLRVEVELLDNILYVFTLDLREFYKD